MGPMPQWVRPLDQSTGPEWHASRVRSFTTTAYCGKILSGTIELASEDKAERETRCPQCLTSLTPRPVASPQVRAAAQKPQAKRPAKPAPRKKARNKR